MASTDNGRRGPQATRPRGRDAHTASDAPAADAAAGETPAHAHGIAQRRGLHQGMMAAVLGGRGLSAVAELAASALGVSVAIVIPGRAVLGAVGPESVGGAERAADVSELQAYVNARLEGRSPAAPAGVSAEAAVTTGGDPLGAVLALGALPSGLTTDVGEVLHLASMATLTELAVADGRPDEGTENALGALFARLRSDSPPDPEEVVRWARRLGCDLGGGVVGLCAQLTVPRPRHVAAIIASGQPGALVEHLDERLYALLPNEPGMDARLVVDRARSLAAQIKEYGVVGVSSHYDAPGDIPRALQEAELVLEVVQHAAPHVQEQIAGSSYRLLIRTMATHPDEVLRLYHSTVSAIVDYDRQYSTDLAHTLTTYLSLDCNMRATAAAVYAHRHTVAYRLDRVRDLTGLDPSRTEDREQLGLGLKAHQVLAPRLPGEAIGHGPTNGPSATRRSWPAGPMTEPASRETMRSMREHANITRLTLIPRPPEPRLAGAAGVRRYQFARFTPAPRPEGRDRYAYIKRTYD